MKCEACKKTAKNVVCIRCHGEAIKKVADRLVSARRETSAVQIENMFVSELAKCSHEKVVLLQKKSA
jgi:hypothetical protein